jgi:hypothetical protein
MARKFDETPFRIPGKRKMGHFFQWKWNRLLGGQDSQQGVKKS